MANTHSTLSALFTAIADAIRLKNKSTNTIIADNFPIEIANLKTGFDYNNQNVTALPNYAFYDCEDLNNVDCSNLTNIGTSAFENCKNLKTIFLYENVIDIGENAFKGCNEVTIYCEALSQPETWHESWNPDNRPVIYKEIVGTWDASATEEDNVTATLYYFNNEYSLVIGGNGKIKYYYNDSEPWNNYRDKINSVIISDDITDTNNGYFFKDYTSLTSAIISNNMIIDEGTFDGCIALTSVNIPNGTTSIKMYTFRDCKSLISITIPDSVTTIAQNAFQNCSKLASINIPNGVTFIGNHAFENCRALISITIPDSVTTIEQNVFDGCYSLTSAIIGNGLTAISKSAFSFCSNLTSVIIGNNITNIGTFAFEECYKLTSINIPNSVTNIEYSAFRGCKSLISITYTGTIAQWNEITFSTDWNDNTGNYTVHCTDGDIAKDGTITYHTTT